VVKVREVMALMEEMAPLHLAREGDNVGLMLGSPEGEVRRILVCLDVTPEVVEEAIARRADLIVSHHPFFYRPLTRIDFHETQGDMIRRLILANISVYSAHTNLDSASQGVNHFLALRLGLKDLKVLVPVKQEKYLKLVTFVPEGHEGEILEALARAGAGHIGSYSHCTFRVLGKGTFLPLEGTSPFIGTPGSLTEVNEYRLETILPVSRLAAVLKALQEAHPYEEVAYDLYPLENQGLVWGMGRLGFLEHPLTLKDLALQVKERLGVTQVRVIGEGKGIVRKVAVCGGSGAAYMANAKAAGADVLITGDVKYHEARQALHLGLALIDAGHFATERVVVPALAEYLGERLHQKGVMVLVSQQEVEPWSVV